MAAYKDYYAILGVPKTATQKDIRAAFRKLAAKHHPDKNPGDQAAEERFKEVNEAYTVLSDEEKRKFYDQFGTADGQPPFNPRAGGGQVYTNVNPEDMAGFSDFFQSLFGGGFGGFSGGDPFADYRQQEVRRPARPANVEARLELDLETAFHGGATTIAVDGQRIEVQIPKGARGGTRLRLRGQAPGGGDLILLLSLAPHPVFKLDGDDVRVSVSVPDYTAVLGGSVRVPTLSGDVEMSIPAGTQAGRVLRLRGQGWPRRDGARGDEFAEVRLSVPRSANEQQRALYQQLKDVAEQRVAASD